MPLQPEPQFTPQPLQYAEDSVPLQVPIHAESHEVQELSWVEDADPLQPAHCPVHDTPQELSLSDLSLPVQVEEQPPLQLSVQPPVHKSPHPVPHVEPQSDVHVELHPVHSVEQPEHCLLQPPHPLEQELAQDEVQTPQPVQTLVQALVQPEHVSAQVPRHKPVHAERQLE